MRNFVSVFILLLATVSFGQDGKRIKVLSEEINNQIQSFQDYDLLSASEKRSIRSELLYMKQLLNDLGFINQAPMSQYSCAKQSNGRFFPINVDTFKVVGSTSYNAGYSNSQECKVSLPEPGSVMACGKQSNGRFYPIISESFDIKGSTSYNASYPDWDECKKTLPEIGQKVTCAKQSNGRFYPIRVESFTIVGSSSYNASYPSFEDCVATL